MVDVGKRLVFGTKLVLEHGWCWDKIGFRTWLVKIAGARVVYIVTSLQCYVNI